MGSIVIVAASILVIMTVVLVKERLSTVDASAQPSLRDARDKLGEGKSRDRAPQLPTTGVPARNRRKRSALLK